MSIQERAAEAEVDWLRARVRELEDERAERGVSRRVRRVQCRLQS
jgi:hypothetical protein